MGYTELNIDKSLKLVFEHYPKTTGFKSIYFVYEDIRKGFNECIDIDKGTAIQIVDFLKRFVK